MAPFYPLPTPARLCEVDGKHRLTPSPDGLMVRRWRLIGYFPILYNPHHLQRRVFEVAQLEARAATLGQLRKLVRRVERLLLELVRRLQHKMQQQNS
jgi:hypothetical protein